MDFFFNQNCVALNGISFSFNKKTFLFNGMERLVHKACKPIFIDFQTYRKEFQAMARAGPFTAHANLSTYHLLNFSTLS